MLWTSICQPTGSRSCRPASQLAAELQRSPHRDATQRRCRSVQVSPERHSDTEASKMVFVSGVEPTFESQGSVFVHPDVDPAADVVPIKSSGTEEQAVARRHEQFEFAVDRMRQKVVGEIS